jgi:hypothetical protein
LPTPLAATDNSAAAMKGGGRSVPVGLRPSNGRVMSGRAEAGPFYLAELRRFSHRGTLVRGRLSWDRWDFGATYWRYSELATVWVCASSGTPGNPSRLN